MKLSIDDYIIFERPPVSILRGNIKGQFRFAFLQGVNDKRFRIVWIRIDCGNIGRDNLSASLDDVQVKLLYLRNIRVGCFFPSLWEVIWWIETKVPIRFAIAIQKISNNIQPCETSPYNLLV